MDSGPELRENLKKMILHFRAYFRMELLFFCCCSKYVQCLISAQFYIALCSKFSQTQLSI